MDVSNFTFELPNANKNFEQILIPEQKDIHIVTSQLLNTYTSAKLYNDYLHTLQTSKNSITQSGLTYNKNYLVIRQGTFTSGNTTAQNAILALSSKKVPKTCVLDITATNPGPTMCNFSIVVIPNNKKEYVIYSWVDTNNNQYNYYNIYETCLGKETLYNFNNINLRRTYTLNITNYIPNDIFNNPCTIYIRSPVSLKYSSGTYTSSTINIHTLSLTY